MDVRRNTAQALVLVQLLLFVAAWECSALSVRDGGRESTVW